MQQTLIDPIDAMTPEDLRAHLRNAYANCSAQEREIEMLHRLRVSLQAEVANKTRDRDMSNARVRHLEQSIHRQAQTIADFMARRDEMEQDLEEVTAQRDELLAAGNELLERLALFRQDDEGCNQIGCDCWNNDGGEIVNGTYDEPAICNVCGEECECTRCADLISMREWRRLAEGGVGDE